MNEQCYIELVDKVLATGNVRSSRAGNTRSLPGQSITYTLKNGELPLLTTRRMYPAGVLGELAAFVRGAEDLATFKQFGCNYWDDNAAAWWPNKDLPKESWQIGKSYGSLWRNFHGVDQLARVIDGLRKDPMGRRHVVSAWDPSAEACLPSCHIMFQFYVQDKGLHCHVYMRSVDLCVGLPSDALLYAVLTSLAAKDVGLRAESLTFSFGDAHVYENHVEQFIEQRERNSFPPPRLLLAENTTTLTFVPADAEIVGYVSAPPIKYAFNA